MPPLSPPVRIGRYEPIILVDVVIQWGPVSVITARPAKPRILVEDATGFTTFRRTTEPRC